MPLPHPPSDFSSRPCRGEAFTMPTSGQAAWRSPPGTPAPGNDPEPAKRLPHDRKDGSAPEPRRDAGHCCDMADTDHLARVWDIIERVGVCMLTSHAAHGLRARPVEARPDRDAGLIWFVTDLRSGKEDESE